MRRRSMLVSIIVALCGALPAQADHYLVVLTGHSPALSEADVNRLGGAVLSRLVDRIEVTGVAAGHRRAGIESFGRLRSARRAVARRASAVRSHSTETLRRAGLRAHSASKAITATAP